MSGTIGAAVATASARLAAAGAPDAARDARILMADALAAPAAQVTPRLGEPLAPAARAAFERHVAQRLQRRPVAQILGRRSFWGREFEVTADTLDPRPETETLIALALAGPAPRRLLDLGVGGGAILVTLLAEWPRAWGVGVDLSGAALAVAGRNAVRHGVAARAEFRRADWTEGLTGAFDLVVCNPPYIPAGEIAALAPEVRDWEPRLALSPGPTGLEAYERLAASLGAVLAPDGRALLEFGAGQGGVVAGLFEAEGFVALIRPDLDGRDRVVVLRSSAHTG